VKLDYRDYSSGNSDISDFKKKILGGGASDHNLIYFYLERRRTKGRGL